eukprot:3393038-Amphidinium_carterae.1
MRFGVKGLGPKTHEGLHILNMAAAILNMRDGVAIEQMKNLAPTCTQLALTLIWDNIPGWDAVDAKLME